MSDLPSFVRVAGNQNNSNSRTSHTANSNSNSNSNLTQQFKSTKIDEIDYKTEWENEKLRHQTTENNLEQCVKMLQKFSVANTQLLMEHEKHQKDDKVKWEKIAALEMNISDLQDLIYELKIENQQLQTILTSHTKTKSSSSSSSSQRIPPPTPHTSAVYASSNASGEGKTLNEPEFLEEEVMASMEFVPASTHISNPFSNSSISSSAKKSAINSVTNIVTPSPFQHPSALKSNYTNANSDLQYFIQQSANDRWEEEEEEEDEEDEEDNDEEGTIAPIIPMTQPVQSRPSATHSYTE